MVHNEFDKAFILSEKGISRMEFHYQWEHEEAPKRKMRNPWSHRPDRPIRYEKVLHQFGDTEKFISATQPIYRDYTAEEIAAWKIERDEYMRQRDEWIALQMFHEYGYETFLSECDTYSLTKEFRNSVFPCESKTEPQCSLYCSIFKDCALRERR